MTYEYVCHRCKRAVERVQVLLSEADDQWHEPEECQVNKEEPPFKLERVFTPTKSRGIVYANDRNNSGDLPVGGPRDKARYLKERGMIEVGNDIAALHQMEAEGRRETDRQQTRELHHAIMSEMKDYSESDLIREGEDLDNDFHDEDYARKRYRELTGSDPVGNQLTGAEVEVTQEDIEEVCSIVDNAD